MNQLCERLFFALWPDQSVRKKISNSFSRISNLNTLGRFVSPQNLHITLHFLGNIPLDEINCFVAQAKNLRADSFNLEINQLGYFRKPKVLWIGPQKVSAPLMVLHEQLGELIQDCGFSPEQRNYSPHITLVRHCQPVDAGLTVKTVVWPVNRFVLLQSIMQDKSVSYRVKASFELNK